MYPKAREGNRVEVIFALKWRNKDETCHGSAASAEKLEVPYKQSIILHSNLVTTPKNVLKSDKPWLLQLKTECRPNPSKDRN